MPGVISHGMLYISGQLSVDPQTGRPAGNSVAEEAAQALKNLEAVLQEAGLCRENVVQCRVYIPDVAYWDELNKAYSAFFGEHRPARVVVPSGPLHGGCRVEIEAIAECE